MLYFSIQQRLRDFLRFKRLEMFEACVIGLVSGLVAVLLKQGIALVSGWRITATHSLPAWIILPSFGLVGGLIAGLLVEKIAPEAAGGGVAQVKAALGGAPIALNLRVAVVKLLSGVIALGSGLPLGRQGPTVQVGAALAAQLSRWIPTSPDYQRQLIAAGAGAGLAAAFNAPIAGVLFVIEELLQDVSGLTMGTAILASFIGAVVSRLLGGGSLDVNLNTFTQTTFVFHDIPFYVVLGALAGLIGALFNRSALASVEFNRRVMRVGMPWRVGLAGLVSGGLISLLPTALHDSDKFREALILGEVSWQMALIALISPLILSPIAYGSGAPGGLFAPTLLWGSAIGYLVGLTEQSLVGSGSPTTFALAGMGAAFSGFARVPITAVVIIFEMTTDFNLVLPLMIVSAIAYLVGEAVFSRSLYERLLEGSGIYLKKANSEGRLTELRAADLMQRHVETLASQMTLDEAVQTFSRSHHRGFPVVEGEKLVGIVTQSDLTDMASRGLPGGIPLHRIMTPRPVTVSPMDTLAHVLYLLNRHQISRLPVTEGRKLVGIITRADIIKAESDRLGNETTQPGSQFAPSYAVYQTRAPATGKGRLLLPLGNPQTAGGLIRLAATVARDRGYELECLQVVLVPRTRSPAATPVDTVISRRLLSQAVRIGKEWQIPVHTQVRASHDLGQAILDTINERQIDLLVMGWKGTTSTPDRIFGAAVDTLIQQAACDVMMVKFSSFSPLLVDPTLHFHHWLVPIAGGPNSQQALQLLPSLIHLSPTPIISLCQVFVPSEIKPDLTMLNQAVQVLSQRLNQPVATHRVLANSVPEAVVSLAQEKCCDVIVLGATKENLLQQVIKGNIPESIARNSQCSVIVVRRAG